jgi:hypothetical protein
MAFTCSSHSLSALVHVQALSLCLVQGSGHATKNAQLPTTMRIQAASGTVPSQHHRTDTCGAQPLRIPEDRSKSSEDSKDAASCFRNTSADKANSDARVQRAGSEESKPVRQAVLQQSRPANATTAYTRAETTEGRLSSEAFQEASEVIT